MLEIAQEIPATMRFDPHTIYTFKRGPNAGRAVKWVRPGEHPFEDYVHVITADGLPFGANTGKHEGRREAVCLPQDLVPK
jgi:hypothetical protein